MKYSIFSYILESDTKLPELCAKPPTTPADIFFQLAAVPLPTHSIINWYHHWRLPNGQISISAGKDGHMYWLRFPRIVDFQLSPGSDSITAYRHDGIPDQTIRHLLLDQVIPRLLSHQGKQILHASCIQTENSALAFCGESGWGKSTLAAYFHSEGHPLLTDDCLLLETNDSGDVLGIPNYHGMRLFQDSLSLLPEEQESKPVAHYGNKRRISIENDSNNLPTKIKAIFILPDPKQHPITESVSICPISGVAAAIALIKNSFPLDITNKDTIGDELRRIATIAGAKNMSVYQLHYPQKMDILPTVRKLILKTMVSEP